jgi:starch synthase
MSDGARAPAAPEVRVLLAVPEIHPLVKTGGLADVAAALPRALRAIGVDARVLVPGYPAVLAGVELTGVAREVPLLPASAPVDLLEGVLPDGTPLYAVDAPALFRRAGGPYQDPSGQGWPDNGIRFATLSRAAAVLAGSASPLGWLPQVGHLNAWQSALAAADLAFAPARTAATVLTVHNIAFGGLFPPELLPSLGLPAAGFQMHGFEFHGSIGFLKAGVYYADRVTTVSPGYAEEIRTEPHGGGLHGLLAALGPRLSGIRNGIDTEAWDPARDPHLPHRFDARRTAGKARCTAALRAEAGLPEPPADRRVPLLGVVSRLAHQKGTDLLWPALAGLLDREWQLVVLGTGEPALEAELAAAEQAAPDRVRILLGFDEGLAHRIEAGADMFLMPSRFEPCGLNQMYSMRYGTIPVVRRTGGLGDTVVDATPPALAAGEATGFVFEDPSPAALRGCLERAFSLFSERAAWRELQRAGMGRDWSWGASARAYRDLYLDLVRERAPEGRQ